MDTNSSYPAMQMSLQCDFAPPPIEREYISPQVISGLPA